MLVDNFLVHSAVVLQISLAFGYLLMVKIQQSRKQRSLGAQGHRRSSLQQFDKRHSIVGYRSPVSSGEASQTPPWPPFPVTTCRSRAGRAPCYGAFRPTRAYRRISTTSADANRPVSLP